MHRGVVGTSPPGARRQDRARRVRALVGAGIAALSVAVHAAGAAEVRATLGGVEVVAWLPERPADAPPSPVVVFSHGYVMCPAQARYITGALAQAGYLVIAPYHADSTCEPLAFSLSNAARLPLKPVNLWSDADFRDRASDIASVLVALRGDASLGPKADLARVALVGHSLGGYTVLGLAGAWPSWTLPDVRAVVAYAPYALPLIASGALGRMQAPVMLQGGSLDPYFTIPLRIDGGAITRTPAGTLYVEIDGAAHLAWTDAGVSGREAIVRTTLAFLDHHVRGLPERASLRSPIEGVSSLERAAGPAEASAERRSMAQAAVDTMSEWLDASRRWLEASLEWWSWTR